MLVRLFDFTPLGHAFIARWCVYGVLCFVARCGSKTDAQNGARKNATWRRWKTVSAPSSTVSCNRLTAPCTRDITIRTVPRATRGTPNSPVRSHPRRFHGAWAQQPQHPSVTWLRPWYLLHSRCASDLPPTCPVSLLLLLQLWSYRTPPALFNNITIDCRSRLCLCFRSSLCMCVLFCSNVQRESKINTWSLLESFPNQWDF